MKSKCIWVANQYASTLDVGFGGRSYFLAEELAKYGHSVSVFACDSWNLFHKSAKINGQSYVAMTDPFTFIWLKGIKYTNSHSIKRVINWVLFSFKFLCYGLKNYPKPDVIICSVQPLFCWPVCWILARRYNAKLIVDVRDIWPLTLIELGGMKKFHPLVVILNWIEKWSYKYSDLIISPIKYLDQHAANQTSEPAPFHFIANGFTNVKINRKVTTINLPKSAFKVMYLGTIGLANALHTFVEAADLIKEPNIAFILVGEGAQKQKLMTYAEKNKIRNIHFYSSVSRQEAQLLMKKADVLFIGARDVNLYEFGVSPNKLFEYFNAKRPIIFSIKSKFQPVEDAGAGIVVAPENPRKLAAAVLTLKDMPKKERDLMGKNGYDYAHKHFTYEKIAKKLNSLL